MKKKGITKIISAVSVILCLVIAFGSVSFAYSNSQNNNDTQSRIDYTETASKITQTFMIGAETALGLLNSAFPNQESSLDGVGDKVSVRFPFIIVPFKESAGLFASIKSWMWVGTKVTVLGYSGDYTHVRLNEEEKGYIFSMFLEDDKNGTLKVPDYADVYQGASKELAINYNGAKTLKYAITQDDTYIEYSKTDKGIQIKGIKPGTAKVTVTAGTQTKEFYIHCIYKWKLKWTGAANKSTGVRKGPGEEYAGIATIPNGGKFTVYGDEGGSEGWAYGCYSTTAKNYWGFVRIENISTKNTVSYYNSLGWDWPLEDTSIKHISSTYGPRSTSVGSSNHRGIDVTTGIPGEISGEPLVAPFDGVVKKAGYNDSCGNYICITSEETDPVTGYKIIAIYMHMESSALYKSQDKISQNNIVGYVGTTGDSSGYHLHMEANNRNAAVGDSYRATYTYTINPLYFYMDVTPTFSNNSAYINHGGYWYNENA